MERGQKLTNTHFTVVLYKAFVSTCHSERSEESVPQKHQPPTGENTRQGVYSSISKFLQLFQRILEFVKPKHCRVTYKDT